MNKIQIYISYNFLNAFSDPKLFCDFHLSFFADKKKKFNESTMMPLKSIYM